MHKSIYQNESWFAWLVHILAGLSINIRYMYDAVSLKQVLLDGGFGGCEVEVTAIVTTSKIQDVECTRRNDINIFRGKKTLIEVSVLSIDVMKKWE